MKIFGDQNSRHVVMLELPGSGATQTGYSTGTERQTPTGGTISGQTYLGFTKNKHSADILSPRATPHKLFSSQL